MSVRSGAAAVLGSVRIVPMRPGGEQREREQKRRAGRARLAVGSASWSVHAHQWCMPYTGWLISMGLKHSPAFACRYTLRNVEPSERWGVGLKVSFALTSDIKVGHPVEHVILDVIDGEPGRGRGFDVVDQGLADDLRGGGANEGKQEHAVHHALVAVVKPTTNHYYERIQQQHFERAVILAGVA